MQEHTIPSRKPPQTAAQPTNGKRQIAPCSRIARQQILEIARRGLPAEVIASRASTGERRVREVLAGAAEFYHRLPARLRTMLPWHVTHAVTTIVEQILAECEQECFTEREVA